MSSYHNDPVLGLEGALPLMMTNEAFAFKAKDAVPAKLDDREDSANVA